MSTPASGSKRGLRILLVCLLLLVVGFFVLIRSAFRAPSFGREMSLNEVVVAARSGEIRSAILRDEDSQIVGLRCAVPAAGVPSAPTEPLPACAGPQSQFHVFYPRSDVDTSELLRVLQSRGARVLVDKQTGKAVTKLVITFIMPLLMLANLFGLIFLWRGGDSSIADIAGFGAIGRKRQRRRFSGTGVSFADVAGADEAVAELREVTDYLKEPEKYEAYGAAAPKGVLLFGPPGCGKTLLARAAAGESDVPFFSISGAEFVESLVGVGAARVRDLFRQVRDVAPAIVFIDEIDAVGRRRGGEGSTGGEREQTVNQLLVEMDGFEITAGIVLMAATNRPDILDPALLRPGRFDRHITVGAPDIAGRQQILELHAKEKPLAADVDFGLLARRTPGFTGADLSNVINEAALLAIREGEGAHIRMANLMEAIQRVIHGPQRRGQLMSVEERRRLAFHESGHAIVSAALGQRSDVHRVSIVARGRGLGQSVVADDADRVLLTVSEMEAQLAMAMGGIASEVMIFGESSTTAEDDIEKASSLAREMVGLYGMSPVVGRVRVLTKDAGYLGGDVGVLESVSTAALEQFDNEVTRLIKAAEQRAGQVLAANRPHLDRLVDRLEQEETLEGHTLDQLLRGVSAGDPSTSPPPATHTPIDWPEAEGRPGTSPRRARL